MKEIQAVKTAKIEEVKKNSKKGFTLVELVVVIAILAVLAAIAIPVVSSTIASSQRSAALSDAQTLELALKEAHAQIIAKDTSVYQASATVKDVVDKKSLQSIGLDTTADTRTIGGTQYTLSWDAMMINAIGWIVAVKTSIVQSLLVVQVKQLFLPLMVFQVYSDFDNKYAISVLLMTDNIQAKGSPSASLLKCI